MGVIDVPALVRPSATKSWRIKNQEGMGSSIENVVWHDCPYDENEMFAVDLECELCQSIAPAFIQLAVKLGTAHTVSTMLSMSLISEGGNLAHDTHNG
jgi:hypothetical protein